MKTSADYLKYSCLFDRKPACNWGSIQFLHSYKILTWLHQCLDVIDAIITIFERLSDARDDVGTDYTSNS